MCLEHVFQSNAKHIRLNQGVLQAAQMLLWHLFYYDLLCSYKIIEIHTHPQYAFNHSPQA